MINLQFVHNGGLDVGKTYVTALNFPAPYGIDYSFYWYVVVDINGHLGVDLFETSINQTDILVNALPDLYIIPPDPSNAAPNTKRSGEPFEIMIYVRNKGSAPVIKSRKWYIKLYLSDDTLIDPFDKTLLTVEIDGGMETNATLSRLVYFFVPFDLPSTVYYIIIGMYHRNILP